jgi:hypothetical protein
MVQVYIVIGAIVFWVVGLIVSITVAYFSLIGLTILIGATYQVCRQSEIVQRMLKKYMIRREEIFYRRLRDDLPSNREIREHFWYLSKNLDVLMAVSVTIWREVDIALRDYYSQNCVRQDDRTFLVDTANKIHKYIPTK